VAYYEWLIFNIVLFLGWLSAIDRAFPWFFIILIITAIPLIIFYMREVYQEYRWWLYAIVTLNMLNLMVFIIWGFVPSGFPWYPYVCFVYTFILFYKRSDVGSLLSGEDLVELPLSYGSDSRAMVVTMLSMFLLAAL
jgi:hypothetical protein